MLRRDHAAVTALFLVLLNLTLGINFVPVSPVLPNIMESYDLSRGMASLLTSSVVAVQAVLSIPGGFLAARLPSRHAVGVGWLVGGSLALTPLVGGGFYGLLGLRFLFGLSLVLAMPAAAPVVMRNFSSRAMPLVNSLNIAAFTLGIGIGVFAAVPIADLVGWENMLALTGGTAVAGALLWYALGRVPEGPRARGDLPRFRELVAAARSRVALLIAIADGGAYAQYMALTTWLPTFFQEVRHLDAARAGFIAGLMPAAGLAAVVVSGLLSGRLGVRKPFIVLPGLLALPAGLGTFMTGNMAVVYLSTIAVGVVSFTYISPLYTIAMEMKGVRSAQVAVVWAVAFSLTSAFGVMAPPVVGILADQWGTYLPGLVLLAVASTALLWAGLALPETGPRAERG